jgi:hypothetical protein
MYARHCIVRTWLHCKRTSGWTIHQSSLMTAAEASLELWLLGDLSAVKFRPHRTCIHAAAAWPSLQRHRNASRSIRFDSALLVWPSLHDRPDGAIPSDFRNAGPRHHVFEHSSHPQSHTAISARWALHQQSIASPYQLVFGSFICILGPIILPESGTNGRRLKL